MGLLVDGRWHEQWYDTKSTGGKFERSAAKFRNWVTASGDAGPSGRGGFKAEPGRYHLYVSLACPWAHRTLIFRSLKGLEDMVNLSVVNSFMGNGGWSFTSGPGVVSDPVAQAEFMHEIYVRADPTYSGRVTVPVLWDKESGTIVSNESSEIIRMFNSAFDAFDAVGALANDYFPDELRSEIDVVNARIYETVNNGVYRAGFATTQEAYDGAVRALFDTMDWLEQRLAEQRYLVGRQITEADWRLFTTLARFDAVYHGHFKCNLYRLVDYKALWGYTRELYQRPGVADTVNFDHIRHHYYASHETLNPSRIVPIGPRLDFTAPHGRDNLN
ncbi:MAG: glutathione S-transferase family protein [Hyphomicrobiaceae bacterium]